MTLSPLETAGALGEEMSNGELGLKRSAMIEEILERTRFAEVKVGEERVEVVEVGREEVGWTGVGGDEL